MRYYTVALFTVMLDQYTKWLILTKMELYASVSILDQFFYITSHRNRGAAFGILQEQWLFFIMITAVVVVVLFYYIYKLKKISHLLTLSLSLILGGAVGNFIDRAIHREVIDFLDFRFGTYQFPVFNLADSAIVVGVCIVVILSVFYPQLLSNKGANR